MNFTDNNSGIKSMSTSTFAATADHFDDPALSFWDRFGRETVARLGLHQGDHVFDGCCGTGASALPAAQEVGATGQVLGFDLAEPPLELARAKARAQGLTNAEFRLGDIERTGLPAESFDAVVCVFGVFFVPDMAAAVAELWRLLRPGGVLALTVWGPGWLEPATTDFWTTVGAERPDLVKGFHPWTRVTTADALARLYRDGGATAPVVEAEPGTHPLPDPEDWWTIVRGMGYRATVEQLGPAAEARVRDANVAALREAGVRQVQTNIVYGRARKPARS
ncbi:methyltransferase domain-containing protein [Actinoplanes sp. TBRC 11911]|uniref:class I SAM-dependent methyltransferase n=1 Tax=Actinoplanes sp. TBRC 11911 TaxID=2729386 RepID=UPI00145E34C2|nr:methyltransferase domain-containing protein [Actinoplanes sp. TBRC 11911]NMO49921.1 methyltransferase domain-containing protein [Actinoplanes sp. TBRC 11911]